MEQSPQIDDSFYKALAGEDDLGVVVRAHIHIEATLIDFINKKLTDLKTLRRLRFGQRVELACELGLCAELKDPLKILGEIRNDFAHKIDAELNRQKVERFFSAFDGMTQNYFQTAYEASGSSMLKEIPKFSDLNQKDKFIIMAVVLKARAVIELTSASSI